MSTAKAVLAALQPHNLQQVGPDAYRSNSPLRPGSDSGAFSLKVTDGEHGMFYDFVSGEGGSLYKLAQLMSIPLPEVMKAQTSKRPYSSLKDYALAHGLTEETLRKALWEETTYKGRNALVFRTHTGKRYRFLDGQSPHYISENGYKKCWYGLNATLLKRLADGLPLVIANGEISVISGQTQGLAALCVTGGESEIPFDLLNDLKMQLGELKPKVLIALDCDHKGRTTAKKIEKQFKDAGYDALAVDLGLGAKQDLADFCMLHGQDSPAAIQKMNPLPVELKAPQSRAWSIVTIDDLYNLPTPKFLLDPYIPLNSLVVMFGESGVGKSFMALDMAMRVSEHYQVVYIAAEGQSGYMQRVEAWRVHYGKRSQKFHFVLGAVALMDDQDFDDFYANLEVLNPELVIVDTLARSMMGSDENNARDMGLFVEACDRIRRDFQCAVMIVHHSNKSGIVRGSSALKGAADMMIELRGLDSTTQVHCEKSKNTAPFEPQSMKLLPKHIKVKNPDTNEQEEIVSAVMVDADLVIQTEQDDLTMNQRAILDMLALDAFTQDGASRAEIATQCRLTVNSAATALSSLLRLKFVTQEAKYQPYYITEEGRKKVSKVSKVSTVLGGGSAAEKTTPPDTPQTLDTLDTFQQQIPMLNVQPSENYYSQGG